MKYRFVDTHCHPNLGDLKKEQGVVIERMRQENVAGIVVGVDLESSEKAIKLSKEHEHLYACVGLHPNYTLKESFNEEAFDALVQSEYVVGVGECGIDYFRQSTTSADDEVEKGWKERQWEVFEKHISLAVTYDKPLMIHCRPSKGTVDAYEEVASYLESLKSEAKDRLRGNMHFFVGNLAVARRFWALGFTTSFTGVLTFTDDYNEIVREAPLDMLLSETDAPYAAPVPFRGSTNYPTYVRFVAEAIARLRSEPEEEVIQALYRNAQRVFNLAVKP